MPMGRKRVRSQLTHRKRRPHLSDHSPEVLRYLEEAGIRSRKIADLFWSDLRDGYGSAAERFETLANTRRRADKNDDSYGDAVESLYRLKNSSLTFSLAITSQYAGRQYAAFLTSMLAICSGRHCQSVLDIGCDNGIATCFYARLFPTAQVIGVDRCPEGIACAKELARTLGIENVTFVQKDPFADENASAVITNGFDLVAMSLCGYETTDRGVVLESQIASQLFRLVSPAGAIVVMEYLDSLLLPTVEMQASKSSRWDLVFEAFGGDTLSTAVVLAERSRPTAERT